MFYFCLCRVEFALLSFLGVYAEVSNLGNRFLLNFEFLCGCDLFS